MEARTERKVLRKKILLVLAVCVLATASIYALISTLHSGGSAPPRDRVLARFRATLRSYASVDATTDLLHGASTSKTAPKGLRAFLGVMSDQRERRDVLRETWFPDAEGLQRLEASAGIRMRFVVGHWSNDPERERAMNEEESELGDILRLPVNETYTNLPMKTWVFFRTVYDKFTPDYILKTDDDLYTQVQRLPYAMREWAADAGDYVGCSFINGEMYDLPRHRFFEPLSFVFGKREYYLFFSGGFYALSRRAAGLLRRVNFGDMRIGAGEDTTIGLWMLAFNVSHTQDPRLCHYECEPDSIAVTGPCNGLCSPKEKMLELHADPKCHPQYRSWLAPPLPPLDLVPVHAWCQQ
ncbi:hypothetical protein WJX81_006993 [Elliptochloris bilobata]|uniref:Hexosyltransferase n=1 Tax=Elliptochloris bilobata TaxID=381761 RepID=A0AAW1S0M1_9CHLO